jgi:hypothetical protein
MQAKCTKRRKVKIVWFGRIPQRIKPPKNLTYAYVGQNPRTIDSLSETYKILG